jgi:endonuclease I
LFNIFYPLKDILIFTKNNLLAVIFKRFCNYFFHFFKTVFNRKTNKFLHEKKSFNRFVLLNIFLGGTALRRLTILFIVFFASRFLFAQNDYYKGTDNIDGKELQQILYTIIKGHHRLPYSSSSTDVWDALKQTDADTTNPSDVILFYTGWKRSASKEYDGGKGWNREHVWPKSHGFPSQSDTAYTDIHHLRPADVSVNSARGSKDFDYGGDEYIDPDGDTGCKTDNDSWEPRDQVKGDVARIVFYMATRYQGFQGYDLQVVDYTGTSGSHLGKLSTLIEWNRLDPPSDYERHRNDVIFSIQHNRNPFIDHPEFADRIYLPDNLLIEKAEALSKNTVLVTFNLEVDSVSASKISNYFIDKGIGQPENVEPFYQGSRKTVLLHTKEFTSNTKYILKISGVTSGGKEIAEGSIVSLDVENPVKVEFNLFSANIENGKIKLSWEISSQPPCVGYAIERASSSENKWHKIAFVDARTHVYYDTPDFFSGTYLYRLKAFEADGSYYLSRVAIVNTGLPQTLSLKPNYPNPFGAGTNNEKTTFEFFMPQNGFTTLKIYNLLGQEIRVLISDRLQAGKHSISFDSHGLSSGIYFYRLQSGNKFIVRKMTIVQ